VRAAPSCLAVVVALTFTLASADADDGARAAATTFGRALVAGNAQALRPILPEHGRVHMTLSRLGPEEGSFGARQVEAVFRDFLARGKVSSYDVTRCESDGKRSALAHGAAAVTDRDGRSGRIGLHLGFESEGERWVLREVKETAE
jgi:hypothetical protein